MDFSDFKDTNIVPIDFTENSYIALDHASSIAHATEDKNFQITLLHVMEGVELDRPYLEGNPLPENSNQALMVEGAISRFKRIIEERLKNVDAKVSYAVAGGKVYKSVPEVAERMKANTIVMGTKGAEGNQGFLVSNAARVIQIASNPTVVVREKGYAKGYEDIILPLDLTKETKQKTNWAIKVASYFNSTVHLVSVGEDDEFLRKRVDNNINQVESILNDNGIKTTATTLTETNKNFADATIEFGEQKGADLIMIMTQQERSFSEYIFGSYAQRIVGRSHIPVMCITPRTDIHGTFEYQESWYGLPKV